jgi:predicted nucleic acid-binding protein
VARYLLDTSALIDYSNGVSRAVLTIDSMFAAGDWLAVCDVVVAEFMTGIAPQDRENWNKILEAFEYLTISWQVALRAGYDRYDFTRKGVTVSTPDALVAAVAREYGATVVTDSARHYPMEDVHVISIRS